MRAATRFLLLSTTLLCGLAFPAGAVSPRYGKAADTAAQKSDLYREARQDLDAQRWRAAAQKFTQLAERGGAEADAALYWKAYAQHKSSLGREALATLERLQEKHPKSAWIDDAKALRIEIRGASGRNPGGVQDEDDEELKLYALNGLMAADSERAVPLLLKFLAGPSSPKLKEQALFVLSQSDSPEARKTLIEVARGSRLPELQRKAIESLGVSGEPEDLKALADIYGATSKPGVKLAILEAYSISDSVERLSAVARDAKEEPTLRLQAIKGLGITDSPQAAAVLKSLYTGTTDGGVRKAALEGLFIQDNAKALIELFRTEKDPGLKREIVQHLSLMDSAEALDFLAKIFDK